MDCTVSPPKVVKTVNITPHESPRDSYIRDMCFFSHHERELLIQTDKQGEISAYNTGDDRAEWRARGALGNMKQPMHPVGVTTDGLHHIFVCDTNNACVQCLSAPSGRYLGPLMRYDNRSLGSPVRVRWCEDAASLVVVTADDSGWYIDVLKLA